MVFDERHRSWRTAGGATVLNGGAKAFRRQRVACRTSCSLNGHATASQILERLAQLRPQTFQSLSIFGEARRVKLGAGWAHSTAPHFPHYPLVHL